MWTPNYYWFYNIFCVILSVLVYVKTSLKLALQETKIEKIKESVLKSTENHLFS